MTRRVVIAGRTRSGVRAVATLASLLGACMVAGEAGLAPGEGSGVAAGTTRHRAKNDAEAQKFTAPAPPEEIERDNNVTRGEAPSDWQPPAQFQGNALAAVYFASEAEVQRLCGDGTRGCEKMDAPRHPLLVVGNPCGLTYFDAYAVELCHELGHANGWPADHIGGHWAKIPPPSGYVLTIRRPNGSVRWRGFVAGRPKREVVLLDTIQGASSGSSGRR